MYNNDKLLVIISELHSFLELHDKYYAFEII